MDLASDKRQGGRAAKLRCFRRRIVKSLFVVTALSVLCLPHLSIELAFALSAPTQRSDRLCPSSHPSGAFLARHLHVSCETVDGCTQSHMLPLQRYHARRSFDRSDHDAGSRRTVAMGCNSAAPKDLQSIMDNPSQFNLSKSSILLLEKHRGLNISSNDLASIEHPTEMRPSMAKVQKESLWKKILAEYRAAQPIPKEALEILYCDAHICVVNKPSGVLSVPGPRRNPSLADLVYETIQPPSIDLDQTVVHRLDMATSGVLVYALSVEALSDLHRAFKQRNVQKTYEALVEGHLLENPSCWEGEIDVDLERDPDNTPFMRIAQPRTAKGTEGFTSTSHADDDSSSDGSSDGSSTSDGSSDGSSTSPFQTHKFWRQAPKPSRTTWSILSREYRNERPVTRLELRPLTGRTHQLRVHTSQVLGAPIVGDDIYGRCQTTRLQTDDAQFEADDLLCLHAKRLCIFHPISGAAMIFEADPPF